MRRARFGSEAAFVIGTLGIAALAFGAADALDGSGFLAVYLAGLALGSYAIPAQRAVTVFHQGLATLAQVVMFLVLGLLVFPEQLGGVALEGAVLAVLLVFVARPLATLVATAVSGFDVRERVVLAWAGLRGAVPVVLATFPVIDGVSRSLDFFNIVFFAVLLSTLLQGSTFEILARRLGVAIPEEATEFRRRLPGRASAQVFIARPWDKRRDKGNPSFPKEVADIPVADQLATRIDEPGSVVALDDGRYSFTGPIVAVGSASAVRRAARTRLERARTDADRAWWREVIGALAR